MNRWFFPFVFTVFFSFSGLCDKPTRSDSIKEAKMQSDSNRYLYASAILAGVIVAIKLPYFLQRAAGVPADIAKSVHKPCCHGHSHEHSH